MFEYIYDITIRATFVKYTSTPTLKDIEIEYEYLENE